MCDNGWGKADATVVCRQLDLSVAGKTCKCITIHLISFYSSLFTASFATINAFFGQGTGTIALNNVQCAGTETRLVDCTSSIVSSCSHFDDAGVRCQMQTGNAEATSTSTVVTLIISRLQ